MCHVSINHGEDVEGGQVRLWSSRIGFISSFPSALSCSKIKDFAPFGSVFEEGVVVSQYFDLLHSRVYLIRLVDLLVGFNTVIPAIVSRKFHDTPAS